MNDKPALLLTGARVSRVNEEGEVSLFCYTLGEMFTFRVGSDKAKAWAARLGDSVTLRVDANKLEEGKT